jgi:hypothetical protein
MLDKYPDLVRSLLQLYIKGVLWQGKGRRTTLNPAAG